MASRVRLHTVRDFTGGLHLGRNIFQLRPNESPDMLNMDVGQRGGIRLRRGVDTYGDEIIAGDPKELHAFMKVDATRQVLMHDGTYLRYGTGGAWTVIQVRNSPNSSTMFKEKIYLNNGVNAAISWDGAALVVLGTAYNNNLAAPANGNMPKAYHTATYKGSVFVANTLEGATRFPNRVRWSHPNQPEDYRDFDYIDIDTGHDGDQIKALVPWDDRLLVFKEHSVHVIYGEPPDGLSTFPIATDVGAISERAIATSDRGVYFFDWPNGVFLWNGRQLQWVFERLAPAIDDGDIPYSGSDNIQMGWLDRRLWLSVPWGAVATRDRTFVLDPNASKEGSWVAYDLKLGPFLQWDPPGSSQQLYLAGGVGKNRVLRLEQSQTLDDFGDGDEHIDAYWQSPWYDLGEPAVKKRWKRPEAVLIGGQDCVLPVNVYKDYDPTDSTRTVHFSTSSGGTAGVWDADVWDTGIWGYSGDERWVVDKATSLGTAKAVSLKINGPTTNVDWGVDALSLKYIPKPVRS